MMQAPMCWLIQHPEPACSCSSHSLSVVVVAAMLGVTVGACGRIRNLLEEWMLMLAVVQAYLSHRKVVGLLEFDK